MRWRSLRKVVFFGGEEVAGAELGAAAGAAGCLGWHLGFLAATLAQVEGFGGMAGAGRAAGGGGRTGTSGTMGGDDAIVTSI